MDADVQPATAENNAIPDYVSDFMPSVDAVEKFDASPVQ